MDKAEPSFDLMLARAPVEHRRIEFGGLDTLEAAYIHRDHRRAVRHRAASEGFDAAGFAEQVLDLLRVETVFGQRILPLFKGEGRRRRKGQDRAATLAIGTVAGDRPLEACLD